MPKADITQARLKTLLDYDPLTGVFVRLVRTNTNGTAEIGQVAGSVNNKGYITIGIDGKYHQAHRLAWFYVHGTFPPNGIDHINGVKSDNRLVNLRPATQSENNCNRGAITNSSTGWCRVSFDKPKGKYSACIRFNNKQYHLGYYDSPEIAAAVYAHVCQQVHGEFAKPDIPDWLIPDSNTIRNIGGNMRQISKCLAAVAIFNAQLETQKENT